MKYIALLLVLVVASCKDDNPDKIEKIQFATGGCNGTCPIFEIDITADRQAEFYAQSFNYPDYQEGKRIEGLFTTQVDEGHYRKIIAAVTATGFKKLPSTYGPDYFDDQDARLIVTYDGGKVKDIELRGVYEIPEMVPLCDLMDSLRFNQKWQRVDLEKIDFILLPNPPKQIMPRPILPEK